MKSDRHLRPFSSWLAAVAIAAAIAFATARCARDVPLGVDPRSDAGAVDAAEDGAAD